MSKRMKKGGVQVVVIVKAGDELRVSPPMRQRSSELTKYIAALKEEGTRFSIKRDRKQSPAVTTADRRAIRPCRRTRR